MRVLGLALVGAAALIHLYIFVLESLLWTKPSTRRAFGVRTEEEAETMRVMAFNQGFYNLFLAVTVGVGVVFVVVGETTVGFTLILVGAGSMFLAAVVLRVSSPGMIRAAMIQGAPPLLGLVALGVDLLS